MKYFKSVSGKQCNHQEMAMDLCISLFDWNQLTFETLTSYAHNGTLIASG